MPCHAMHMHMYAYLEETGMSYEKEVHTCLTRIHTCIHTCTCMHAYIHAHASQVQMVAMARGMGLLTTPYVFDVEESQRMAAAGADVVVAHMGLTTKGRMHIWTQGSMHMWTKGSMHMPSWPIWGSRLRVACIYGLRVACIYGLRVA